MLSTVICKIKILAKYTTIQKPIRIHHKTNILLMMKSLYQHRHKILLRTNLVAVAEDVVVKAGINEVEDVGKVKVEVGVTVGAEVEA